MHVPLSPVKHSALLFGGSGVPVLSFQVKFSRTFVIVLEMNLTVNDIPGSKLLESNSNTLVPRFQHPAM